MNEARPRWLTPAVLQQLVAQDAIHQRDGLHGALVITVHYDHRGAPGALEVQPPAFKMLLTPLPPRV